MSNHPSLPELLGAVRAWLSETFPGRTPKRLIIVTVEDDEPISLPVPCGMAGRGAARPPAAPPEAPAGVSADGEADAGHFSPCITDILTVLEQAARPLTSTRILDALSRAGKEWSRRHVEKFLSEMVKDGTIENPKGAKPAGYRLPEWETTSGDGAEE